MKIRCHAFTLIELLTVIAVIGVLAAFVLAALPGAKERSSRAACKSNVRQFIIGLHLYGADNNDKLLTAQLPTPRQPSSPVVEEYSPVVSAETLAHLTHYVATEAMLRCPALGPPYAPAGIWHHDSLYQVLGSHYLGG